MIKRILLFSLSYAMHVALLLEPSKAQFVHDKIEDLIGQADEVDRKFLQVSALCSR